MLNQGVRALSYSSQGSNSSHTLGSAGRSNSKPSSGSSGHAGGTSPGQTRMKPKDLSLREREEHGCGEGVIGENYFFVYYNGESES